MADFGISEVLAIGSLASTAVGGVLQGKAQADQANYQAAVARNNEMIAANKARYDAQAGQAKAADLDLQQHASIGKAIAAQAASGLDINSGSQKQVIDSSETIARLNTLRTAQGADMQVRGDLQQAADFKSSAGLYDATASNTIPASLISTGAGLSDKWLSFQQKGLLT